MTDALTISGYVREASERAASQPCESTARAQRNSSNVVAFPSAADEAQAAFFGVVKTASELTSVGLPEGKTVAEALARATARKEFLWRQDMDEDEKIAALLRFCTSLYRGNETAGQLLASAAIWEG